MEIPSKSYLFPSQFGRNSPLLMLDPKFETEAQKC